MEVGRPTRSRLRPGGYLHERSLFRPGPAAVRSVVLAGFEPVASLSAQDWRQGCETICANRLAGTTLRLVESGEASPPEEVLEELRTAAFSQALFSVRVLEGTSEVLEALSRAGIGFVVSKGLGIADIGDGLRARPFSDLDVIVDPAAYSQVLDLCASLGYREAEESRQCWDWVGRVTREAINLTDGVGGSIDVHQTVPPWYWGGGLTYDLLTAERRTVTFGGRAYPCLSPEANLLIAALHVVSDKNQPGANLMVWRDALVLMRASDPDRLRSLADRSGTAAWLRWILQQFPSGVVPSSIERAFADAPRHVDGGRRLSLLMPPHIGSRHLVSQPLRLPLLRAAAFIAGSLLPSPTFLRSFFGRDISLVKAYPRWWYHTIQTLRRADTEVTP